MGQIMAVGAAGLCAVAAIVGAPIIVQGVVEALGFTAKGIMAGSPAAFMMSLEAIAGGGALAAGGLVAALQSIGAVGMDVFGTNVAMGGATIIVGTVFWHYMKVMANQ